MTRNALVLSFVVTAATISGCASTEKAPSPPPMDIGFLSTYRNLVQVDADSWRYLDPTNRLGRYDKFIVHPVEFAFPEGAKGWDTKAGDIKAVIDYMHETLVNTIGQRYEVVDAPAWDVGELRVAMTDAYDKGMRVNIAMQGEIIDAVSNVQIAALVESQVGRNVTTTRFWQTHDAKMIMDGWAERTLAVIDEAHGN